MKKFLFCLGLAFPLFSQGVYFNANNPGDPSCPKIEVQTDPTVDRHNISSAHGNLVAWGQSLHNAYPPGQRKDVSSFTAYDEKGKGTSIASLKGRIVVLELWGANCEPSAHMLMDLAQLYGRREKFGFEILAVNFDRNNITGDNKILGGWSAIKTFETHNKDFFSENPIPFYVPGIGKEGGSNFLDVVYSLPLLAVIDRDGKLASLDIGYQPKIVSMRLSQLIKEEQATKASAK